MTSNVEDVELVELRNAALASRREHDRVKVNYATLKGSRSLLLLTDSSNSNAMNRDLPTNSITPPLRGKFDRHTDSKFDRNRDELETSSDEFDALEKPPASSSDAEVRQHRVSGASIDSIDEALLVNKTSAASTSSEKVQTCPVATMNEKVVGLSRSSSFDSIDELLQTEMAPRRPEDDVIDNFSSASFKCNEEIVIEIAEDEEIMDDDKIKNSKKARVSREDSLLLEGGGGAELQLFASDDEFSEEAVEMSSDAALMKRRRRTSTNVTNTSGIAPVISVGHTRAVAPLSTRSLQPTSSNVYIPQQPHPQIANVHPTVPTVSPYDYPAFFHQHPYPGVGIVHPLQSNQLYNLHPLPMPTVVPSLAPHLHSSAFIPMLPIGGSTAQQMSAAQPLIPALPFQSELMYSSRPPLISGGGSLSPVVNRSLEVHRRQHGTSLHADETIRSRHRRDRDISHLGSPLRLSRGPGESKRSHDSDTMTSEKRLEICKREPRKSRSREPYDEKTEATKSQHHRLSQTADSKSEVRDCLSSSSQLKKSFNADKKTDSTVQARFISSKHEDALSSMTSRSKSSIKVVKTHKETKSSLDDDSFTRKKKRDFVSALSSSSNSSKSYSSQQSNAKTIGSNLSTLAAKKRRVSGGGEVCETLPTSNHLERIRNAEAQLKIAVEEKNRLAKILAMAGARPSEADVDVLTSDSSSISSTSSSSSSSDTSEILSSTSSDERDTMAPLSNGGESKVALECNLKLSKRLDEKLANSINSKISDEKVVNSDCVRKEKMPRKEEKLLKLDSMVEEKKLHNESKMVKSVTKTLHCAARTSVVVEEKALYKEPQSLKLGSKPHDIVVKASIMEQKSSNKEPNSKKLDSKLQHSVKEKLSKKESQSTKLGSKPHDGASKNEPKSSKLDYKLHDCAVRTSFTEEKASNKQSKSVDEVRTSFIKEKASNMQPKSLKSECKPHVIAAKTSIMEEKVSKKESKSVKIDFKQQQGVSRTSVSKEKAVSKESLSKKLDCRPHHGAAIARTSIMEDNVSNNVTKSIEFGSKSHGSSVGTSVVEENISNKNPKAVKSDSKQQQGVTRTSVIKEMVSKQSIKLDSKPHHGARTPFIEENVSAKESKSIKLDSKLRLGVAKTSVVKEPKIVKLECDSSDLKLIEAQIESKAIGAQLYISKQSRLENETKTNSLEKIADCITLNRPNSSNSPVLQGQNVIDAIPIATDSLAKSYSHEASNRIRGSSIEEGEAVDSEDDGVKSVVDEQDLRSHKTKHHHHHPHRRHKKLKHRESEDDDERRRLSKRSKKAKHKKKHSKKSRHSSPPPLSSICIDEPSDVQFLVEQDKHYSSSNRSSKKHRRSHHQPDNASHSRYNLVTHESEEDSKSGASSDKGDLRTWLERQRLQRQQQDGGVSYLASSQSRHHDRVKSKR